LKVETESEITATLQTKYRATKALQTERAIADYVINRRDNTAHCIGVIPLTRATGTIEKISEHTWKARHQGITENSHTGHCARTKCLSWEITLHVAYIVTTE
jgi:hypothetical protein